MKSRCKEHLGHTHSGQPEKSAVAEHRFDTGYNIGFKSISVLNRATRYMDHVIKEATEIVGSRCTPETLTGMVVSLSVSPGTW
jgi:hypothetical protein